MNEAHQRARCSRQRRLREPHLARSAAGPPSAGPPRARSCTAPDRGATAVNTIGERR